MKQLLNAIKEDPVPPQPQPPIPGPDPQPYPPTPGPGPQPKPPVQPQKPTNRHFSMMTILDSTRVVKNISGLMDEVINHHLMSVDGANVEIKLLVEATMPDGTPVTTVRTVTENCKALHVEDFGFDE